MAKVPLIPSEAISEFGDLLTEAQFVDPNGMGRDLSHVPGFSEKRRAYDTAVGQYRRREITLDELRAKELPVNFRWARAQDVSGKPTSEKQFVHGQKGFRLFNADAKENQGHDWFTAVPPGASKMADGTIRRGDTILMIQDKQDARRSAAQKRLATERQVSGTASAFGEALKNAGTAVPRGAAPYVEKLPPEKAKA